MLRSAGDDRVGVTGPVPFDHCQGSRSNAITRHYGGKSWQKLDSHLRERFSSTSPDLGQAAHRGEQLVSGKALSAVGHFQSIDNLN